MKKNEIVQVSDREHVRLKPGMYVGDISRGEHLKWLLGEDGRYVRKPVSFVPAFLKLFDEIVANSIDEGFRTGFKGSVGKFRISVDVRQHLNEISVHDNGRGIPILPMKDCPGITQAEGAVTLLRAGTNFEKDDDAVSAGTHGLGATIVNLLSTEFRMRTVHGGKVLWIECSRGTVVRKSIEDTVDCSGTNITFCPDWSVFEGVDHVDDVHLALIQKRVTDLAACIPQIEFRFQGKRVDSSDFRKYLSAHSEHHVSYEDKRVRVGVFAYDQPMQVSLLNGIETYEGGSHVDYVRNRVADEVAFRLNKKHKTDMKPQDVKNHLCFVVTTNVPRSKVKFRSQTKEHVSIDSEFLAELFSGWNAEKFAKELCDDVDIVDPMVQTFLLKKQARENAEVNKKKRELKKIKVAEYMHANGKDRSKCILFLSEGQSAIGQLSNVRDSDIHGGFPLKGKPLNVNGCREVEIVSNKEYAKLMSIIGLRIGEPVDLSQINYGTIAIMADADHDGNCIVGLLMNFFALWPQLFDAGIVKVCRSPIVKWEKGKQKRVYYDLHEYMADQNARQIPAGAAIKYLKGLGSLQKEEYAEMIQNPRMQTVIPDHHYMSSLELVFGPDAAPRKPWLTGEERA